MSTLLSLHWAAGLNAFAQAGVLAVAPKALATAWRLRRLGVYRIHAHFATHTATCAGITSAVSKIPYSFTAHAYDIYCTTLKQRNETIDWKLRHASRVFAISKYGASLLRARMPVGDRDRVQTVYVGIPLDLFREQPPPSQEGGIRLLCIGSYDEKKGLDTLIDACALLRDQALPFSLRIYGDGPLKESLANRISRLELSKQVHLIGPISQEEVAQQMALCHLFVMPCRITRTTGNMDGIPTVFMEAMATGRPVISCPISGIPELVRHEETGLLVPSEDPPALAEAVTRLSSDTRLRVILGKQARALVERQHDQCFNARRLLQLMTTA